MATLEKHPGPPCPSPSFSPGCCEAFWDPRMGSDHRSNLHSVPKAVLPEESRQCGHCILSLFHLFSAQSEPNVEHISQMWCVCGGGGRCFDFFLYLKLSPHLGNSILNIQVSLSCMTHHHQHRTHDCHRTLFAVPAHTWYSQDRNASLVHQLFEQHAVHVVILTHR